MLIDTHCHIHDPDYPLDIDEIIKRAHDQAVEKIICVGTSVLNSHKAIEFASAHDRIFASVGVHPHNAKEGWVEIGQLLESKHKSIIAVGEIGLDYHYNHSSRDVQIQALQAQIELALKHNLPIVFHVREAFDDFWPVFDNFHGISGELHSFTDTMENAQQTLNRGLYIGVNGYSTFTKDESQKTMFAALPLEKLLLETDAPYLTPYPFRNKVNEPAYIKNIADYHAMIRKISTDEVAITTTTNACALFEL
jgi:TatD DNase family protein